ncbi:hypothetical protein MNBD_UNCLBAC01-1882 [hydrothermal vent metagenome]|uniref:PIN domain-containing protein n=1 Tax=hydrothermal vent metagenome TaxID=652676 RepID=A0A3B1DHP5_9ZZZZ
MKILFDTYVFVAAVVERHPVHKQAFKWLKRAKEGEFELYLAAHSLAELYAVLTVLPLKPKIFPSIAQRLIQENVVRLAKISTLSATDYNNVVKHMSSLGFIGGFVYDALILKSAQKASVNVIVTFNVKDFKRLLSEDSKIKIIKPE